MTTSQSDRSSKYNIKVYPIAKNNGRFLYRNQYALTGTLVDMWADLIEGAGEKFQDFVLAFEKRWDEKKVDEITVKIGEIGATGFFAPYRDMLFIRRDPLTLTLYVAIQGNDLYVSWRAFLQRGISTWKVYLFIILSGIVGMLFSQGIWGFDPLRFVIATLTTFFLLSFLAVAYGMFFQSGDWVAFFRKPFNELHADDIVSLTNAVHLSIIHALDDLGIDEAKLATREPYFKTRKKPRI